MSDPHVMAYGACFGCGRPFGFNPRLVPSYENQPICGRCVERVNPMREANGLPPITVPAGAYEPAPEAEVFG